jgi:hypothetical protein
MGRSGWISGRPWWETPGRRPRGRGPEPGRAPPCPAGSGRASWAWIRAVKVSARVPGRLALGRAFHLEWAEITMGMISKRAVNPRVLGASHGPRLTGPQGTGRGARVAGHGSRGTGRRARTGLRPGPGRPPGRSDEPGAHGATRGGRGPAATLRPIARPGGSWTWGVPGRHRGSGAGAPGLGGGVGGARPGIDPRSRGVDGAPAGSRAPCFP